MTVTTEPCSSATADAWRLQFQIMPISCIVNFLRTQYFQSRMRSLVLAAIAGYQRYLSPHKGFCCAYRVHTGHRSCSTLGYRAVRRYGVLLGLKVLRRRMYLCGVAHRRFSANPRRPFETQRGFCDVGCDIPCDFSCDLPSMDSCSSIADIASCCDGGSCDWPNRDRKRDDKEQYVHIPPRSET